MKTLQGSIQQFIRIMTLCLVLMFISGQTQAQSLTAEMLLSQGKAELFQLSRNGTLEAFQTFSSDYQPTSNATVEDQIRLFRSISRLGAVCFSKGTATSDSLEDLLHKFGIGYAYVEWTGWDTFTPDPNQSLENLEFIDQIATQQTGTITLLDDVDYSPPSDAPSTGAIQAFLDRRLIPALDASLTDLGQITDTAGFQIILTPQDIPTLLNPVEIDSGDLYLFQAGLKAVKGMLQIATAYDLGLDLNWLTSMADQDALTPDGIMGRFPDLLQLLSTSSPLPSTARPDLMERSNP